MLTQLGRKYEKPKKRNTTDENKRKNTDVNKRKTTDANKRKTTVRNKERTKNKTRSTGTGKKPTTNSNKSKRKISGIRRLKAIFYAGVVALTVLASSKVNSLINDTVTVVKDADGNIGLSDGKKAKIIDLDTGKTVEIEAENTKKITKINKKNLPNKVYEINTSMASGLNKKGKNVIQLQKDRYLGSEKIKKINNKNYIQILTENGFVYVSAENVREIEYDHIDQFNTYKTTGNDQDKHPVYAQMDGKEVLRYIPGGEEVQIVVGDKIEEISIDSIISSERMRITWRQGNEAVRGFIPLKDLESYEYEEISSDRTVSQETEISQDETSISEMEDSQEEEIARNLYVNEAGNCIIPDISSLEAEKIDELLRYTIEENDGVSSEHVGKQFPGIIFKIGSSGQGIDKPEISIIDKSNTWDEIFKSKSISDGTKYAVYYYSTALDRKEADKEIDKIKEFLNTAKENGAPPQMVFIDRELPNSKENGEVIGRVVGKDITDVTAYQIATLNKYVKTGLYTDYRIAGKDSPERILDLEKLHNLLNDREIPFVLWGAFIGDTEKNEIKEKEFRNHSDLFFRQTKHEVVINGQSLDVSRISANDFQKIFECKNFSDLTKVNLERVELANTIIKELENANPEMKVTLSDDYYIDEP